MDRFDEYDSNPATRSTPVDIETPDDETPPQSRQSPSFSFHEERRLLKSDEYWLAHKIPRLPPSALSTSPSASVAALDGLSLSRYDFRDDDKTTDGGDGDENQPRQGTMLSPTEEGYDPVNVMKHRVEMDKDERMELEEERRERELDGSMPADQFDTGESPGVASEVIGERREDVCSSCHNNPFASGFVLLRLREDKVARVWSGDHSLIQTRDPHYFFQLHVAVATHRDLASSVPWC